MTFRPLHDRVVVRRAKGDLKSKGGIIIQDTARQKQQDGEVTPLGRACSRRLVPLDVETGDVILFEKWAETGIGIDGEDLLIVKECDVMGIVEKTEATADTTA
ncbi:chaperonin GroES 2 (plasmid) [Rhizobium gallicum bv. gallicum R602sp]|uniref:Co-chaperonin GroES n=1 Tax=Rhizobium gallicum bv. gallicum R602sp TaxID=1041138 RepID=A0A0B4XCG8_9HYPH|nr:co-chaperone GroES [Rhizobium gallicum]AJD44826.1 chaperonin GroES 2 [Rhizobium gallicum bv. gallicum R602sp]